MKECKDCAYSKLSYGRLLCMFYDNPRPALEYMRKPDAECGIEGHLFTAKGQKYAEYDDA